MHWYIREEKMVGCWRCDDRRDPQSRCNHGLRERSKLLLGNANHRVRKKKEAWHADSWEEWWFSCIRICAPVLIRGNTRKLIMKTCKGARIFQAMHVGTVCSSLVNAISSAENKSHLCKTSRWNGSWSAAPYSLFVCACKLWMKDLWLLVYPVHLISPGWSH